jgi:hypothetical protein
MNTEIELAIEKAKNLIQYLLDKSNTFPPILITHKFADTDALLSVAFLYYISPNSKIRFLDPDKFIPAPSDMYIGVDIKNSIPNCIGHEHLDVNWSSCRLIFEAFKNISAIKDADWFNNTIDKLDFLVSYCTRAEQRLLDTDERGKGSLVNLLYGLRSQQDIISDDMLFAVFYNIFISLINGIPNSMDKVAETDIKYNIHSVINRIPEIYNSQNIQQAIHRSNIGMEELIATHVEFKTLSNGLKVAINRSYHNLIRQIFSKYHVDIVIFENKYRRIGLIVNAKSNINLERIYEFLKDKDSRWKFIKDVNLLSKKVSIEEFEVESPDKIVDEIVDFLDKVYTKTDETPQKRRRVSTF